MPDTPAPDTAPSDLDIVVIPGAPWHVPKQLTLPAQIDTEGRVWPCAGVRRVQDLDLDRLRAAGVEVRWTLPNGEVIAADVGAHLIAARRADVARGEIPTFEAPAPAAPPSDQSVEGQ